MYTFLIMVSRPGGHDYPFCTSDPDGSRPILVVADNGADALAQFKGAMDQGIPLYVVECAVRDVDGGAL